jgi:glycosyltransferase involved in cell wall biosynthesis
MATIAVTGLRGVPATWGGVERQCEETYSRLSKRHRIVIYARQYYVPEGLESYRGLTIRVLPTVASKYLETFVHTGLAILDALRQRPDILHIYAQGPCLFSWLPRIFRPRMRVFFTCTGLDWMRKKWPWWASRIIYLGELASVLFPHYRIAVSKDLQKYYERRYGVAMHYIPNGVEFAERRPPDRIRQFGLSPRDYFLFVGRLVPEKRIEDIIEAYIRHSLTSKLVIVGDSAGTEKYAAGLRNMAEGRASIIFAGYQYGEMLKELYSNARAFVAPSELEGLPLTLLEAMSFGLPCIASDIPPHREVVQATDGFLYPTAQVTELARKMAEVDRMSEEELCLVGNHAQELLETIYSWDKVADEIDRLYQESLR